MTWFESIVIGLLSTVGAAFLAWRGTGEPSVENPMAAVPVIAAILTATIVTWRCLDLQ